VIPPTFDNTDILPENGEIYLSAGSYALTRPYKERALEQLPEKPPVSGAVLWETRKIRKRQKMALDKRTEFRYFIGYNKATNTMTGKKSLRDASESCRTLRDSAEGETSLALEYFR